MKVILLENIASLGNKGDIKDISDGYASNFLVPAGKAAIATMENVQRVQAKANKVVKQQKARDTAYDKVFKSLNKQNLVFSGRVSDKDNLFKGVSNKDIIVEVKEKFNLEINDNWFARPVSFKKVGKHSVELQLPTGQK